MGVHHKSDDKEKSGGIILQRAAGRCKAVLRSRYTPL